MWRRLVALALLGAAPEDCRAQPKKKVDKKLSAQVLIKGGWGTFGTSFADEDVPKDFAPEDKEGAQVESLKETLDPDIFGAIAGATAVSQHLAR